MFALIAVLSLQTPEAPADCARAMTTPEINACATRDLDAETRRMEDYLAAARRKASADDEASAGNPQASSERAYLDNAQIAWAAYAAITCDGVHDRWRGGTIRTVMYLGCNIRMTHERTQAIWRDFLTYADSTPPILPEPRRPVSETWSSGD